MARRYIGDAVIEIWLDEGYKGEPSRFYYMGRVTGCGKTWRFSGLASASFGFGPGIAADSPEAYDRMAASAAEFGSNYTTDNRLKDEPLDGFPSGEVSDAIAQAIVPARGDDRGRLEVSRSRHSPARLVS